MSKKSGFRGPIDTEDSKRAQALLKSASHHLYHILGHCQVSCVGPFDKEHSKRAQALLKSASHHLYHIVGHCQVSCVGKSLSY